MTSGRGSALLLKKPLTGSRGAAQPALCGALGEPKSWCMIFLIESNMAFLQTRRNEEKNLRNKIFGGIGAVWGSLILYNGLSSPASEASSAAYRNGQLGALAFGALLLGVGLFYFFKKPKPKA